MNLSKKMVKVQASWCMFIVMLKSWGSEENLKAKSDRNCIYVYVGIV